MEPLARYSLNPEGEPETQLDGETTVAKSRTQRPLIMIVELDQEERRRLIERYAHDLDIDPRRLLVELRLTVLQ